MLHSQRFQSGCFYHVLNTSRVLVITLLIHLFLSMSCSKSDNYDIYTFPAEFEPHESIWLTWVQREANEHRPADNMAMEIIRELAPYVEVSLVVDDPEHENKVKQILDNNEVPYSHVNFFHIPKCNRWMRDMGPIFVRNSNGDMKIVDYQYSSYGERSTTDEYPLRVGKADSLIAGFLGLPLIKSDIVSEGGAREFNGKGTMIVVEAVELQRNPEMTRDEIEQELKRTLGQEHVIWLKEGPAEDAKMSAGALPGNIFSSTVTGGHIDEFCRFTGPNTILLAEVSPQERDTNPISRISYDRLEESYTILKDAVDQDGKPFKIIRMPVTDHLFKERTFTRDSKLQYTNGSTVKAGDTVKSVLSSSYLNFLVTNGVVLAQAYWKEGRPESIRRKDEESLKILQSVFPDRKIVQMHSEILNYSGGGIHCITQQQPISK